MISSFSYSPIASTRKWSYLDSCHFWFLEKWLEFFHQGISKMSPWNFLPNLPQLNFFLLLPTLTTSWGGNYLHLHLFSFLTTPFHFVFSLLCSLRKQKWRKLKALPYWLICLKYLHFSVEGLIKLSHFLLKLKCKLALQTAEVANTGLIEISDFGIGETLHRVVDSTYIAGLFLILLLSLFSSIKCWCGSMTFLCGLWRLNLWYSDFIHQRLLKVDLPRLGLHC